MRTLLKSIAVLFFALVCVWLAYAQIAVPSPIPNDTVTGTTQNKLFKYNTTSSATSGIITSTGDKSGAIGTCADGCGTSGKFTPITVGQASLVFDNTTVPNDYVTISSTVAGDGHDFGSTCPTDGSQVIGTVYGAGGSAGTYQVHLQRGLCPAITTTPACALIGSSDTLTAAGTFATQCSPTLTLSVGSLIEVQAHGIYTTTSTASPQMALQVNAGGTSGLCSSSGNINPATAKTNGPWEIACYIQISTTGAPGTATIWGHEFVANPSGSGWIGPNTWVPGPVNYTTNSAQTFSIQETATFVSGQSITLQSMFVRQY